MNEWNEWMDQMADGPTRKALRWTVLVTVRGLTRILRAINSEEDTTND